MRLRPLGPQRQAIAAPRETVFDVIAEPYLGKTPRAMKDKLEVLERGSDMVLAAHHTPAGGRTWTTVETVRFERPGKVHFRLTKGPVAHVLETFTLNEAGGGTEFLYEGELGSRLPVWGGLVARAWENAVRQSVAAFKVEAERRAGAAVTA